MTLARVTSGKPDPLNAVLVEVEADVANGLYNFVIVGMAAKDVDEAKDRVPTAIKNSGFKSPRTKNKKVVVSLSPASIKKEGSHFDLPIALSYLLASEEIKIDKDFLRKSMFIGELSLSGEILPVRGALSVAKLCRDKKIENLFIPIGNQEEVALVEDINIYPIQNLKQLTDCFSDDNKNDLGNLKLTKKVFSTVSQTKTINPFKDVIGQDLAKRALLIAASGGHNIALYGPPGTGKTMLARAMSELLPNLSKDETLEVTMIHSFLGETSDSVVTRPPFRSPHHTASDIAIVGGGSTLKPGEITLAHRGILFMDEFPEFDKNVLECLRQPLEDGYVTVSRAKGTQKFPAKIILLAALNPCPCGYRGTLVKECICKENELLKYERKISGPVADRIDLWVEVNHIPHEKFAFKDLQKSEVQINLVDKVSLARETQVKRFGKLNSELSGKEIDKVSLSKDVEKLWVELSKKFDISPRQMQRLKKVARTIADVENSKEVTISNMLEAFQFRKKNISQ